MAGVLSGIKVIDLSEGIAGPMATMMLADHGAHVTRIERPGGDPFRKSTRLSRLEPGQAQRRIGPDQSQEDKALLVSLLRHADVFVESFPPGKSQKFGLDHETLSAINP